LAIQVHSSMARAIQPFSTFEDGDTLFAVSTQEVGDANSEPNASIGFAIAAETMWDAILASVPSDPPAPATPDVDLTRDQMTQFVGVYQMGPHAMMSIDLADGNLRATLNGMRFFDLGASPATLHATSETEFHLDSRYGTRLAFTFGSDGKAVRLTVNPGQWAQRGERVTN